MIRRRIGWQVFFICYFITAFALWFSTWYSIHTYKDFYIKSLSQNVTKQSKLLAREFEPAIAIGDNRSHIDSLCKLYGSDIEARLTIILPSGKVLGDSKANPDTMENHLNRPEISQAIQGKTDREIRYSTTLRENTLYYATPLFLNKQICGVLRLSVSLGEIKQHESIFYHRLIVVSIILFVILGIVIYIFTTILSKPIRAMKKGAQLFAQGDFNKKLTIPNSDELGDLARTLNSMAISLDDRIQTITRQRNELTAILVSLNEGVIAVDNNEKVISMNPAASKILNITQESACGCYIHQIVRNSTLQKFLTSTLSSKDRIESAFSLPTQDGELYIQAYGTVLVDHDSNPQGAVLVLNDITRIRKLENLRKEFVSNVSHELRTPLTSIKGFVETIRSGDYKLPEEVTRFLTIISSKTDNLCSIVEDILTLSSIERDNEHREISMNLNSIQGIIQDAINTCHWKAVKKNISIKLECPSEVYSCINAPLIEQAIVNLLDNAIKYSNENTDIIILVKSSETELTISVQDHGCGIAEEHLGRVFERFYRVDKARSRKLGGTGLGLSIVKNIISAHNGNVIVNSKIGIGSTFEICLPHKNSEKD
jgi:two-component system, OmpR family, phosphate regulon sensor histidine kinase PhoR